MHWQCNAWTGVVSWLAKKGRAHRKFDFLRGKSKNNQNQNPYLKGGRIPSISGEVSQCVSSFELLDYVWLKTCAKMLGENALLRYSDFVKSWSGASLCSQLTVRWFTSFKKKKKKAKYPILESEVRSVLTAPPRWAQSQRSQRDLCSAAHVPRSCLSGYFIPSWADWLPSARYRSLKAREVMCDCSSHGH